MKMQIAVATLKFGDLPYFRYSESINRYYCDLHGYSLEVIRPPRQIERSPIWFKVRGVADLLPKYDFVLFLDADAYFFDLNRRIESLAEEHLLDAAMLFGTDRRDRNFAWSDSRANTGVFLVRNCVESARILEDWWNSPLRSDTRRLWAWPPEQGALNDYVLSSPDANRIRVVPYVHLNGTDGEFIRHLIRFPDSQRLQVLRGEAYALGRRTTPPTVGGDDEGKISGS